MESGSEQSEKHQGGRLEDRAVDKHAIDVAAQLTAGSDMTVDPQVSLRLRWYTLIGRACWILTTEI